MDTYSEKDLEAAILRELERFILELGAASPSSPGRSGSPSTATTTTSTCSSTTGRLRRLVAIDLKLGEFEAADKGQMELYLRWLEKHEREPGEEHARWA